MKKTQLLKKISFGVAILCLGIFLNAQSQQEDLGPAEEFKPYWHGESPGPMNQEAAWGEARFSQNEFPSTRKFNFGRHAHLGYGGFGSNGAEA